ncbi:amino acid adenylation domain-containing protein [Streptomyces sp. ACA25]|uniref:non-ribosomal peptide synthetase n=1 Tax=Streptomyces sp. ACA25 TaxID=3022596 RepID=UPI0023071EA6|nr:non-ribosomal peptide synthetase [Streptomyces sp. ACA25]MDB1087483.1 amino acid adenylation domain-containing protein [Streptomyces sp. ACA25]
MSRSTASLDDRPEPAGDASPEFPAAAAPLLAQVADAAGRATTELRPGQRFADLGVDSFGALRLRRAVARHTGVELPLPAFLGDRTVGALCADWALAEPGTTHAPEPAAPPLPAPPDDEDGSAPLTAVQAAYWAGRGDDFPLGGVATFWYHEYDRHPGDRRGSDALADLERLEEAWNSLIRHHAMLRTVIGRDGRQRTLPAPPPYTLGRTDLRAAGPEQVAATLAELREERSHQVRPPHRWPLFDLHAVLLPDGRTRLLVGFDVLVIDFASWRLLMRQWSRLAAHPGTRLPSASREFTEIVRRRETDPAERARHRRDRAHWQERLATLPDGPRLPYAVDPATLSGTRFARHSRRLDAAAWQELGKRAARHGISPTAVLLGAFSLVMARWGATEPFAVNTTLYDRPEDVAGVEHLVGDFTTTALVAVTPPDPLSWNGFAEHARAVNHTLWEAIDHRSFSGVEVLREPAARPDPAAETVRHPVVFTSGLGIGDDTPPARGIGTEVFGVSQTPQVLMDHLVWQEDGDLRLLWDVAEEAFPAGFVDGLAEAQYRLLRLLAEDDDAWNRTDLGWDPAFRLPEPLDCAPFGDCGPLLDAPLRQAARERPDAPAVLSGDLAWTHGELDARAARLAARLTAGGAGPGWMVLVALPKGPAQIAAVLAVSRTGAGYVPVDPSWPASRIAAVCSRAEVRLALVPHGTAVPLPAGVHALAVDRDARAADDAPVPPHHEAPGAARTARPDELAYAIFTSGSTGAPKGVAVEHRAARTTVDDITDRFGITAGDRVLGLSALSFDLSVYDIYGLLGAGGALVLPDAEHQRDPEHWCTLLERHRVTVWNTAPALLEMLVEFAEADPDLASRRFASLRLVMLSGDWIPVTLPDRLRALAPGARVMSLGGATEASIWSITFPVEEVDPGWRSIPYGRPLRGQFFHVLDSAGGPCPVGEVGELFIAGDGLARGYLGDEAQTADRFARHPVLGERLYRTGDLGRRRSDGQIEFLGRTDRQVKVRGHRIELGDIEAALDRLPGVRQAAAGAVPGPDSRPRLVVYVAPASGAVLQDRELTGALAERLPEYMLPSRIVHLEALPVTANGKVDHKALPNPFRSRGPAAARPAEPVTDPAGPAPAVPPPPALPLPPPPARPSPAEPPAGPAGLEAVAREVLGPDADLTAGLLAQGATSLDIVRLANAIEDRTGTRPSFRALVAFPSVTALLDACAPPAPEPPAHVRTEPPAPVRTVPPADASGGTPTPGDGAGWPAPGGLDASVRLRPAENQDPAEALEAAARWLRGLREWAQDGGHRLFDVRVASGDALLELSVAGPAPAQAPVVQDPAPVPAGPLSVPTPPGPRSASAPPAEPVLPAVPSPPVAPPPPTDPAPSGPFALSEMQLAYLVGRADTWLGDAVGPHYYTEVDLEDLDTDRLEAALHRIVQRHPMLRATVTDDTRQTVLDRPSLPRIEVRDLRGLSAEAAEAALHRLRRERSHRVLDPARCPMLHLAATRIDEHRWRLHFGLDLLFCDAQSAVLLAGELLTGYRDLGSLPAPPAAAFADWIHERARAAGTAAREAATAYWNDRSAVLPDGPALPVRPPGPGRVRFTRRRAVLDADRWNALRLLARRHRVTPTAVLLTVFADVLRHATGSEQFTLVVTAFDRPARHAGVIGDYTSTVLLGVETGASTPAGRMRDVQDRLLQDLEHASGPAGVHGNEVLRNLTARRGRQVLLPAVFSSGLGSTASTGGPADASELLAGFGRTVHAISQTPHVVLDHQVFEQDGELRINWDAVEAAFPPGYLDALFTACTELLTLLADSAQAWEDGDPARLAERGLAETGRAAAPHEELLPSVRPVTTGPAGVRRDPEVEQRIAATLGRLLGAEPADLDPLRSFFEIGATSLTLVRAHRELRAELDDSLSVLDLFAHPSISALAAHLGSNGAPSAGAVRSAEGARDAGAEQPADQLLADARRRAARRRTAVAANRR